MLDEGKTVPENQVTDEVKVDEHTSARTEGNMDASFLDLQAFAHRSLDEEDVLGASDLLRHWTLDR